MRSLKNRNKTKKSGKNNKNGTKKRRKYVKRNIPTRRFRKMNLEYHEPYEPSKWNKDKMTRKSHNCYSYFLNKQNPYITYDCVRKHKSAKNKKRLKRGEYIPCGKPQPGAYAGLPPMKKKQYTCKEMDRRIRMDNPSIRKTTMKQDCGKHEYMGAMVIKPNDTYHFYRRDKDGYWSHKKGATATTRYDASNKKIIDPEYSDRNYGELNYSKFCHHYCIRIRDTCFD